MSTQDNVNNISTISKEQELHKLMMALDEAAEKVDSLNIQATSTTVADMLSTAQAATSLHRQIRDERIAREAQDAFVTPEEFDEAYKLHQNWLGYSSRNNGRRMDFSKRHLTEETLSLGTHPSRPGSRYTNLSYASFYGCSMSHIRLDNCNFSEADMRVVSMNHCSFRHSTFHRTTFERAVMNGTDFTGAYMREVSLAVASLSRAILKDAELSIMADNARSGYEGQMQKNIEAKLRVPSLHRKMAHWIHEQATRYATERERSYEAGEDPRISLNDDGLNMRSWHSCNTTHCRAGWNIHLAGEYGYLLEMLIGPSAAGAVIYYLSCIKPVYDERGDEHVIDEAGVIPNFDAHANESEVMRDIHRLAEREPVWTPPMQPMTSPFAPKFHDPV